MIAQQNPARWRATATAAIVLRLLRLSYCRHSRCRRCWAFQAVAITAAGLALLAVFELGPEPRWAAVVPGGFDLQPAGVLGS